MQTLLKITVLLLFIALILALALIPPRHVVINSAGYFNPFKKRVFTYKVVKEGALYYIYFTGDNWKSQVRYTRLGSYTLLGSPEKYSTSGFITEAGAQREAGQFDNITSVLKDLERIENMIIKLNNKSCK